MSRDDGVAPYIVRRVSTEDWGADDLMVKYRLSDDNVFRAQICGLTISFDKENRMYAALVSHDPFWGTGYYPIGKLVPRGDGVGEWEFLHTPKLIRDLEKEIATLALAEQEEKVRKLKEKIEGTEELTNEPTDSGEPVRDGSARATGLRRVAAAKITP